MSGWKLAAGVECDVGQTTTVGRVRRSVAWTTTANRRPRWTCPRRRGSVIAWTSPRTTKLFHQRSDLARLCDVGCSPARAAPTTGAPRFPPIAKRAATRYHPGAPSGRSPAIPAVNEELSRRVERALAEARRLVDRSQVLHAARRFLGDVDLMITRCAWCNRYALAGHWLEPDEAPASLPRHLAHRVTHGICQRCADDLRARGLSR